MSVIHSEKANCKNCYKCVRVCPVKSIKVEHHQAKIIERDCIFCGACVLECPQGAKVVSGDLEKVRNFINQGDPVILSLAPSYYAVLDITEPKKLVGGLKALGFFGVAETSMGAAYVTDQYHRFLQKAEGENILTTSCPSATRLIETYYPSLIPQMAPFVSPMIAHGRLLKQAYPQAKIVFCGPCIAKKDEAADIRHSNAVDAVLTFEELKEWMKQGERLMEDAAPATFLNPSSRILRAYPISGGILESVRAKGDTGDWQLMSVSGKENCMLLCEALERGELQHCFIEMNVCEDGCINGPKAMGDAASRFVRRNRIRAYTEADPGAYPPLAESIPLGKTFLDRSTKEDLPDEETIRQILSKTGKDTSEQELNCGSCGYPTCREKAIAVYQNKAELSMCVPYMRERAESLSNCVLAQSPEMIVIVNEEMQILEFNAAAERVFRLSRSEAMQRNLYEILDSSDFQDVFETQQPIRDKTVVYQDYGVTTRQDILYVPKENVVIGMFRDVTREMVEEERKHQLRVESMEMAQKVIDKQMVVAQQIAFLLGETTAETKATLTQLKDRMIKTEGETESSQ